MNVVFPCLANRGLRLPAIALAFLLLAFPALLAAAPGFASLEEQMTGEEFHAAGLEKLTPQELASLNQWIRKHSLATLDSPRGGSEGSIPAGGGSSTVDNVPIDKMERKTIVSKINGKFSGWDGQTLFKLENGMIWAQTDDDKFYTESLDHPGVTIEPAMFGNWKLSIDGYDDDCKVERIE
jgi:hypothetical protein